MCTVGWSATRPESGGADAPAEPVSLSSWRTGDRLDVAVGGSVCTATVPVVAQGVAAAVQVAVPTVALDLSGVTFIDARGVSMMIRLRDDLASRGSTLVLVEPSRAVSRLLAVASLGDAFRVVCRTARPAGL